MPARTASCGSLHRSLLLLLLLLLLLWDLLWDLLLRHCARLLHLLLRHCGGRCLEVLRVRCCNLAEAVVVLGLQEGDHVGSLVAMPC